MPFVVKKTKKEKLADINIFDELDLIEKRIKLLKSLTRELSDEEFIKIISFCYDYDLSNLDKDAMEHAIDIFGEEAKMGIIDTDLLLYGGVSDKCYIRFDAYVKSSLNIKPRYTLNELENLISTHQIIIDSGCLRTERVKRKGNEKTITTETENRAQSLILDRRQLTDLGPYKEWLLPIIRDAFTKERIASDILKLIASAKELISISKANFEKGKIAAELLIANNNESIARLTEFARVLEKIDIN